ncbi:ABC transporter ATP-binding protein [Aquibacillus rhizosphaerae]|uniref:ABC transporter ATP-binding protein n=1 Tax=Aquibacillus rhizosphaerae TaxID=3051431 RepID=A0ABT7LCA6_9BACI|nr:ABC transporter ATP-binding protein [Aquibacillus sp. LR5S19]MDL4842196.1 ABC transporter ATP-binding protein [Aquibacillus sp. LR5S19]
MNGSPIIEVNQLKLFFEEDHERAILDGISFDVHKNENLLILGPSGCGKSTLTHCLNGLFPRELDGTLNGEVKINGKDTKSFVNGGVAHHIGVVFQDPESQFCMLTVEDEIAFGLENIGINRSEMKKRVDFTLKLVEMEAYKDRVISTLSGGEKQKIALACILAMEPEVIILDEPTANLDPKASGDFIKTLRDLQKEKDFSLIVIEHKLENWVTFIDRCIFMNEKGQIFFDGLLRKGLNQHRSALEMIGISIPQVTEIAIQAEKQSGKAIANLPIKIEELTQHPIPSSLLASSKVYKTITTPLLRLEDISWTKSKTDIIKPINITFYKEQFVAIVGANGSGKSSFSKLIAGLQKPTSGKVTLEKKPLTNWKEKQLRKRIGYVFQNPEHQFITDSVFDEVAFSLRMQQLPTDQINQLVKRTLDHCQLSDLEDHHPYTLSQGQKRRLSVATMIVDDQSLLILDEPTFGQDAYSTKQLLKLLKERYQKGTSIIAITHDMDIVNDYADRVIVIEKGNIALDVTPEQLWNCSTEKLDKWHLQLPLKIKLKKIHEKRLAYVSS